jgi:hypothetical protein
MCEPCKREGLAYVQDFLSMDLITQQWISGSVWRSTIGRGKWLHNDRTPARKKIKKPNIPRLEYPRQSAGCPQDCGVRDEMARDNNEYGPSQLHERKYVPRKFVLGGLGTKRDPSTTRFDHFSTVPTSGSP